MKYLLMVLTGLFLICRIEAMEIKEVLFIGDGITKNAPMPEFGWHGNWGMAATSEDKDYAHLLFALIREISPGAKMNLDNIMYEDTMTGWVHLVGNSAELIIIQLGDNYNGGIIPEEYGNAYRQMIEELRGEVNKTVICLGPWNNTKIEPFIKNAAKSAGAKFISLAQIAGDPANHAGADGVYPKLAGQPGNRGMKRIADAIWQVMNK